MNQNKHTVKFLLKQLKGVKVALLSYTFGTNDHQPTHDYTVDTFDENKIKQDVKKAKQQSDVVLVSAHWGNEGKHQPNATQKNMHKFSLMQVLM